MIIRRKLFSEEEESKEDKKKRWRALGAIGGTGGVLTGMTIGGYLNGREAVKKLEESIGKEETKKLINKFGKKTALKSAGILAATGATAYGVNNYMKNKAKKKEDSTEK